MNVARSIPDRTNSSPSHDCRTTTRAETQGTLTLCLGESKRGGRRAYYPVPDPDGVELALAALPAD